MKSRVGCFISTIITFILLVIDFGVILWLFKDIPSGDFDSLALIVVLPYLVILGLIGTGLCLSTIITAFVSMTSSVTAIKIISAIICLLAKLILTFGIIIFINFIGGTP